MARSFDELRKGLPLESRERSRQQAKELLMSVDLAALRERIMQLPSEPVDVDYG